VSVETKAALEEAIAAHVADECDGDMIGGWVVLAETTSLEQIEDDLSAFYLDARTSQSSFLTTGLLWQALEHGRFRNDG
jgi:hypothetical protein